MLQALKNETERMMRSPYGVPFLREPKRYVERAERIARTETASSEAEAFTKQALGRIARATGVPERILLGEDEE
jgi:hypothetical protein